MLILHNSMLKLSKEKIYGQFFSGDKIPELLVYLLQIKDIRNAIDPMCGSGDMFTPLLNNCIDLYGIELDSEVADATKSRFPNISISKGNAFDSKILYDIIPDRGFDLVITNPPFVRRELLNPIASNGIHPDFDELRNNLIGIIKHINYISNEDKNALNATLSTLSKYSDLSILSLILCIILLRDGGQLALVVPTSWLTREYARPIVHLMNKLLKIDYIIVDSNRVWFEGSASVQTSLVVAHRKISNVTNNNNLIKLVNLFSLSKSSNSLIGNIPENINFLDNVNKGISALPYFEVNLFPQEKIIVDNNSPFSNISKLSSFIGCLDNFSTIEDFGVCIGQGLRTGANKFFYLKKKGGKCYSTIYNASIKYYKSIFKYVVKGQDCLTDSFKLTSPPNDVLLYIQDFAVRKDCKIEGNGYDFLPLDIEKYIIFGETYDNNGTIIPNLSAVKTNVKDGGKGRLPRFWYMIPKATERHFARLFIPRINSNSVICRINDTNEKIFIDANFSSIWRSHECPFSDYAILALLNSKWARIQYEENGTILGGGALKLDAVQIKKTVFPTTLINYKNDLDDLGHLLVECSTQSSEYVITKIDKLILASINILDTNANHILYDYLNQYKQCRS